MVSAFHYLDTSALIKKYILEDGTAELQRFLAAKPQLVTSPLTYAEIHSAFRRLYRDARMTLSQLNGVLADFEADWNNLLVSVWDDEVRQALAHVMGKYVLRGADGMHLASALAIASEYDPLVFVSSDARLLNAARHEKMTFNPVEK